MIAPARIALPDPNPGRGRRRRDGALCIPFRRKGVGAQRRGDAHRTEIHPPRSRYARVRFAPPFVPKGEVQRHG